jgi:hypothetical protein
MSATVKIAAQVASCGGVGTRLEAESLFGSANTGAQDPDAAHALPTSPLDRFRERQPGEVPTARLPRSDPELGASKAFGDKLQIAFRSPVRETPRRDSRAVLLA